MEASTLQSDLVQRAEGDAYFLASALVAWRSARPDVEAHVLLRCKKDDLWRIALAPRPKNDADFAATAKRIADAFAILAPAAPFAKFESRRNGNFLRTRCA